MFLNVHLQNAIPAESKRAAILVQVATQESKRTASLAQVAMMATMALEHHIKADKSSSVELQEICRRIGVMHQSKYPQVFRAIQALHPEAVLTRGDMKVQGAVI